MIEQKGNKSTLSQHIRTASKKVETWPEWQKKLVNERVLANNKSSGNER